MNTSKLNEYITNNVVISNNNKNNIKIFKEIVNLINMDELTVENKDLINLIKNNEVFIKLIKNIIDNNKDIFSVIKDDNHQFIIELFSDIHNIEINVVNDAIYNDNYPLDDSFKLYLKELNKYKVLSKQEEVKLANLSKQGDKEARNKLIKHNLRLVVSIAYKYANKGMEINDLIEEGNIALFRAVKNFNPDLGYKFSTYAYNWVTQAITSSFPKYRTIRIPEHTNNFYHKALRLQNELEMKLGREVNDQELARTLGVDEQKILEVRRAYSDISSLNFMIGDKNDSEVTEFVSDNEALIEDKITDSMLKTYLIENMEILTDREKDIINLRYPLDGSEPLILEDIAKIHNVSRERIRQIEYIALQKLKRRNKVRELAHDYLPDANIKYTKLNRLK